MKRRAINKRIALRTTVSVITLVLLATSIMPVYAEGFAEIGVHGIKNINADNSLSAIYAALLVESSKITIPSFIPKLGEGKALIIWIIVFILLSIILFLLLFNRLKQKS